jgi:hypothetical protein
VTKCTQKELGAKKDRQKILFSACFGQKKVDFGFKKKFLHS